MNSFKRSKLKLFNARLRAVVAFLKRLRGRQVEKEASPIIEAEAASTTSHQASDTQVAETAASSPADTDDGSAENTESGPIDASTLNSAVNSRRNSGTSAAGPSIIVAHPAPGERLPRVIKCHPGRGNNLQSHSRKDLKALIAKRRASTAESNELLRRYKILEGERERLRAEARERRRADPSWCNCEEGALKEAYECCPRKRLSAALEKVKELMPVVEESRRQFKIEDDRLRAEMAELLAKTRAAKASTSAGDS